MTPIIISRCYMNYECRPRFLSPECLLIERKSKCSRLQPAEQLSPERSLGRWSDFAPSERHKLDDVQDRPLDSQQNSTYGTQ